MIAILEFCTLRSLWVTMFGNNIHMMQKNFSVIEALNLNYYNLPSCPVHLDR
jgi:hypothetical protein